MINSKTDTFGQIRSSGCADCIFRRDSEGRERENEVQRQVRRKRSSPDNLIIPTPDTIDIGDRYIFAIRDNTELTGSELRSELPNAGNALKFIFFLINCAMLPNARVPTKQSLKP